MLEQLDDLFPLTWQEVNSLGANNAVQGEMQ